jgi:hypothetical protein
MCVFLARPKAPTAALNCSRTTLSEFLIKFTKDLGSCRMEFFAGNGKLVADCSVWTFWSWERASEAMLHALYMDRSPLHTP